MRRLGLNPVSGKPLMCLSGNARVSGNAKVCLNPVSGKPLMCRRKRPICPKRASVSIPSPGNLLCALRNLASRRYKVIRLNPVSGKPLMCRYSGTRWRGGGWGLNPVSGKPLMCPEVNDKTIALWHMSLNPVSGKPLMCHAAREAGEKDEQEVSIPSPGNLLCAV